ncbi:DUF6286 domain-containing protein [Streptomyces sp. MBT33]|uniref:DUF6286 domain-containing protein n=1 Tax=Streptomyces sp. MBT33 TaxID=1488363 RepID=UPI00190AE504|nr:DUF6286 domain-containing protein [Streptomyces sp. MBT33]MBK3642163.1 hypothetical protein [Streptomyces sp. MBT33]
MSEPQGSEGTTQRLPVIERAPDDEPEYGPPPPPTGSQGRFWSARRVPAAVVALLVLAVAGTFLYDIAAVRAHRDAMAWRRELARQLAQRPLDDTWVLVGAGVAAACGLWLIVLACTPGLRGVLPMRRLESDVHAGLYRDAAALFLRDRAMEVAGVQSVRIRVGRARADVRALCHFRDLGDVRADLNAALEAAIEGLGLARPPALSVHVRRPGRKG